MKTITLTQGEAYDLSACLGATPPSKVPSLKELFLQDKIRQKFDEPVAELKKKQDALSFEAQESNEKITLADKAERAKIVAELNTRLKPQTDEVNALRKEEIDVELSDDQLKYLKDHFQDRIAIGITRLDYAVKLAGLLGLGEE